MTAADEKNFGEYLIKTSFYDEKGGVALSSAPIFESVLKA